ncbi:MAG: rhodanese-like domain-containing protein [Betaproteobacteria bacterium]
MTFVVENWWLILVALASGTMLFLPALRGVATAGLSPSQAVQMINREKAVVIDICETEEFAAGHLGSAKNIPLSQLEQKLPGAVKNKALPLILVCQSGARSGRAVATAKKLGYDKVQALSGGLGAWRTAGLPIEKS